MLAITVRDDADRTLSWESAPDPIPRPGEVTVRVMATAVNRADLLQRAGRYAPPPGASQIMGLECAGVVDSVGEGADPELVGMRVAALLSGGGYAERVAVPAAHLLPIPDSMSFTRAAAIPEVFYTAYLNLCLEADLRPGETVLIHAAASGVGTAALQICRELGCPTIATASGAKLDKLGALGATHCVDRNNQSFEEVVAEVTERGADVVLCPVGADYLPRNIAALAPRGRLVVIGLLGGTHAELDLAKLLRQRLRVIGSVLRSRSIDEKTAITAHFLEQIWPWFEEGRLEPVVDRVMAIEDVAHAHELLRSNTTTGKVVLRLRG